MKLLITALFLVLSATAQAYESLGGFSNDGPGGNSDGRDGGSGITSGGSGTKSGEPASCPVSVPTKQRCSTEVSSIPFNFTCGSHRESQTQMPFKNTAQCKYTAIGTMVTRVDCEVDGPSVQCDPCNPAAAPCPSGA